MASNNKSSIALALAGKTASVDIPKPRGENALFGRDSFAAVTARSLPTGNHRGMLPTPPNSISPTFLPQEFKDVNDAGADTAGASAIALRAEDDMLSDVTSLKRGRPDQAIVPQEEYSRPSYGPGLAELDTAGAITPTMLAKRYLPEILLAHGPLAIRHVMGYLTTSVPGFTRIPSAKARRLIVGALEGRGGGECGGINSDIVFEKVGWGRWDAREKGQPPREGRSGSHLGLSPPASVPSSYPHFPRGGMSMSKRAKGARRREGALHGASWTGDSAVFSHDEESDHTYDDVTMLEHEADKMSLDGSASSSSFSAGENSAHNNMDTEPDDLTDDEDWASIGAAALRQGSLPRSYSGMRSVKHRLNGGPPSSNLAKAVPLHGNTASRTVASDPEEREAVEALMRLSNL
ncbi:MAG: hypothetical protein M1825_006385 [Sarcosagium campestre]|nr:MAG: hypothetical protein M1825_006385 [Sarcosagium campestre]